MSKAFFFIDDDEEFLYFVGRICENIENVSKVLSASDGKDALDKILKWLTSKADLPNLMFVDINMPRMNGFEFLEEFKKLRTQHNSLKNIIPVVMLTSSQNSTDKDKAFRTGIVDNYIIKPNSADKMTDLIHNFLD